MRQRCTCAPPTSPSSASNSATCGLTTASTDSATATPLRASGSSARSPTTPAGWCSPPPESQFALREPTLAPTTPERWPSEVFADGSQKLCSRHRRDDDPAQRTPCDGAIELVGQLEGGDEARAAQVLERTEAPQAERIGEEPDRVPDDACELVARLDELPCPVGVGVLRYGMVVPGVRGDRHPHAVEGADLAAGEPSRLVEHHRHDEEGGDETMAPQERQRARVLSGGAIVEGQQDRLGRQRGAADDVAGERIAGDRGEARAVERI